jgi:hypothetical protein
MYMYFIKKLQTIHKNVILIIELHNPHIFFYKNSVNIET